jgi:hypothetical protein
MFGSLARYIIVASIMQHVCLNDAIDGSLERGISLPVLALRPDLVPRLSIPHWVLPGRFHP